MNKNKTNNWNGKFSTLFQSDRQRQNSMKHNTLYAYFTRIAWRNFPKPAEVLESPKSE